MLPALVSKALEPLALCSLCDIMMSAKMLRQPLMLWRPGCLDLAGGELADPAIGNGRKCEGKVVACLKYQ